MPAHSRRSAQKKRLQWSQRTEVRLKGVEAWLYESHFQIPWRTQSPGKTGLGSVWGLMHRGRQSALGSKRKWKRE